MVERDKYRHPVEVLEFFRHPAQHYGRRDVGGRRMVDRDPGALPARRGKLLHRRLAVGALAGRHDEKSWNPIRISTARRS